MIMIIQIFHLKHFSKASVNKAKANKSKNGLFSLKQCNFHHRKEPGHLPIQAFHVA
jgi:hypothetical protein